VEIRRARLRAGLTQAEAGGLVHASERLWRLWESGKHRMPPASWELFEIKLAAREQGARA
jgi:DNA-binding transcriptional regulator YiaG